MKRKVTKKELLSIIKDLDNRTKSWSDEQRDRCINNAFAEMSTIQPLFTSELSVELKDYYDTGETKFQMNIKEDVTSIYDMFLVQETSDYDDLHDEHLVRDENLIYRNPRNVDSINVDLDMDTETRMFSRSVVKFFFVPTANFKTLYMSSNVMIALEAALGVVAYDMVNDVERSSQKRAAMSRLVGAVQHFYPDDFGEPFKPSLFPRGV